MKKLKRLLIASLACSVALGFSAPTYAAYQLSSEVKTATPALTEATQIGVLTYENSKMKSAPDKDAILVMSFGTTYKDTREKTINATVKDIEKSHPGVKVVTAFTSHIIIDRIKKKENIAYPTPEEALTKLKSEGYTRVALVSLDIIPGVEYSYKRGVFNNFKDSFKRMTIGTPLMYWQGQEEQADDVAEFINAISPQFNNLDKDHAVLLMAHGTPQPANAYYSVIQAKLSDMGYKNVFVYTVEGWPNLETVMPKLKKNGIKKVTLIPIMMVAGDHATNDMAGNEDDSHKKILEKAGFKVDAYLHGLGETKAIRNLYVSHANDAWKALQK